MSKQSDTGKEPSSPVELQPAEMAAVIAGAAPRLLQSCAGDGPAKSQSHSGGVDPLVTDGSVR